MGKDSTWGAGALEDDLLGGDHGEASSDVLAHGVAKLGPGAALERALAEAGAGELAHARGGGDLDLVPLVVEAVLNRALHPVLVGALDHARREEEVEVVPPVVLVELPPPQLRRTRERRRRHCWGGVGRFLRSLLSLRSGKKTKKP